MASWGLAYEYGKNAYEDMWKKQEQNERLAAQRELYNLQLENDIANQQATNVENARINTYRNVAAIYGDKMGRGGTTGVQAYAQAMTAAGVPTTVLDGNKVATIDPYTGKPDMSTVIDMSDTSKWTGDAIKSEFAKNMDTLKAEADKYKATTERDREFNEKKRQFDVSDERERWKARLNANTQLAAAGIYASAKSGGSGGAGGSGSSGGVTGSGKPKQTTMDNNNTLKIASESAARTVFGEGVQIAMGDDGTISFTKNGEPFTPSDGQWTNFYNMRNKIFTDAANLNYATGQSPVAGAMISGTERGTQYLDDLRQIQGSSFGIPTEQLPAANLGLTNTVVITPGTRVIDKPDSYGIVTPLLTRGPSTSYNTNTANKGLGSLYKDYSLNFQF